jgi:hypothetical protein
VYPTINPINIKVDGINLRESGIDTIILLIGSVQVIIAPDVTAISDRIIIGVLIFNVSSICSHEGELDGEKIVAIEKRME